MNHLKKEEKEILTKTIIENANCFAQSKYDIGQTTINECKVNLINEDSITTQKTYQTNAPIALVVNYKKLNDNVQTDGYPFPRIEDILDRTLNCRYIKKICQKEIGFCNSYGSLPMEGDAVWLQKCTCNIPKNFKLSNQET